MAPGVAPQKSCMSESLGQQVYSLHTGALTSPLPHVGPANTWILAHIRLPHASSCWYSGKELPADCLGLALQYEHWPTRLSYSWPVEDQEGYTRHRCL